MHTREGGKAAETRRQEGEADDGRDEETMHEREESELKNTINLKRNSYRLSNSANVRRANLY